MWRSCSKLFGATAGAGRARGQYDPVYGLPRRAVEDWLARNPAIKRDYEAAIRDWPAGHGPPERSSRTGPGRLWPEMVEQRGSEAQRQ